MCAYCLLCKLIHSLLLLLDMLHECDDSPDGKKVSIQQFYHVYEIDSLALQPFHVSDINEGISYTITVLQQKHIITKSVQLQHTTICIISHDRI